MIASTARDCPVVPAVPPLPTAACQPTPETWALRLSEGTESSAGTPDEGASEYYDVWYRAYVQDYGWLPRRHDRHRLPRRGAPGPHPREGLGGAGPHGGRVQGSPLASEFGCPQRSLHNAES